MNPGYHIRYFPDSRRGRGVAQLSLGESKWRMVRRALRLKRFAFADVRNMTRHDTAHFEWLVANGYFAAVAGDRYELTERGRAAAELGFYDLADRPPPPAGRKPGGRR